MDPVRTLLFVPGHRDRMIEKAPGAGADGLLYDLEDSVPAAERATAMLRRDTLDADLATVDVIPHPGQEPGDIVAITYGPLELNDARYRVRSVCIDFTRSSRGRYLMRLGLGAP